MSRKIRTRAHIIADLSINHVERFVFLCGFSTERSTHDYGTDLTLYTYSENGEVENGQIYMQLKATDHLSLTKDGTNVRFSLQKKHLESWLEEPFPFILVVYDAQAEVAYWIYIQRHFETRPGFDLRKINKTMTITIPVANRLDRTAVLAFSTFKTAVLKQLRGVISHA